MRSLRTVYSAINSEAFKNRSGGIEGRPTSLYICSNNGESSLSTTSASALISLIGWLAGTRCSGFTKISIVAWGRSCPRMFRFLLNPDRFVPLYRCEMIRRSHRHCSLDVRCENVYYGQGTGGAEYLRAIQLERRGSIVCPPKLRRRV